MKKSRAVCRAASLRAMAMAISIAAAALAGAQEAVQQAAQAAGPVAYRIQSLSFDITGRTQERPLRERLEIRIGADFPDLAALESYLDLKRQILVNQRVLQESAIEYEVGEAAGGVAPVAVSVRTVDTWNIVALPYPKYDSNRGLLLGARARDYDFLGSMEPLYLNLDYQKKIDGESSLGGEVIFSLPFTLMSQAWTVSTNQSLAFSFTGKQVQYGGKTALRLALGGEASPWYAELAQGLYVNEDGADDEDGWYLSTAAKLGTSLDLFEAGALGPLSWKPTLSAELKYKPGADISADRAGPDLTLKNELEAGRVDWIGNFRRGVLASLSAEQTYDTFRAHWDSGISGEVEAHQSLFGSRAGLDSRLMAFWQFTGPKENVGDRLRGIADNKMDGDACVSVNLDLPVKLFSIRPSVLIKKKWFDFEAHASLIADAALLRPSAGKSFGPWLSGGIELFAFSEISRSVFIRAMLAEDILELARGGSWREGYELFFGLGHAY
jgi:hypothetical protein